LKSEDSFHNTLEMIKRELPDILALSITSNQVKYIRKFLDMTSIPVKLIIAGGVHCTLVKEDVFNELRKVNAVCIGEGERPLKELCHRISNNLDYFVTPGFYFRTSAGIVKNPTPSVQNIDNLPLPDYSLFDYKNLISGYGRIFTMMLGRGCPYKCYYCCNDSINKIYSDKQNNIRFPSVRHAIKIIKNNLSLYPETRKIYFCDETFTWNKKWLKEFSDIYRQEVGLPFVCHARVETINEQVVESLKKAGCESVYIGVESGSEWLRKNVLNRKHSNEEIKHAFALIKKHKIATRVFYMVGLPFETNEMIKSTVDLNYELQPNFGQCSIFYPFPGTPIHKTCVEYSLLKKTDELESISSFFEEPSLTEIYVSNKDVLKYRELILLYFYLRLLLTRLNSPFFWKKIAPYFIRVLRKPVFIFINPKTENRILIGIRTFLAKIAHQYLK
jgi:anaerobic magnesium-protoporphyrin IX monomethyl ester cyclase